MTSAAPRMMRSISASVGKQWLQRICQRCGVGLRLAMLRREVCRTVSACGPSLMALRDSAQGRGDPQVVLYFSSCG